MLVLSRRIGETIVIEGGIQVTVVGVRGDRIRLGITAPGSVRIDRAEVHQRRSELLRETIPVARRVPDEHSLCGLAQGRRDPS